jgi:YHS domain-containing protein
MKYDIFNRGFASVVSATAVAAALCFAAAAPSMAADQPPTNTPAMTPAPAAAPPKGEFDNSCTMGLASGQVVKTDCSINWTAPDGKVYCFSREASKETFLKNPSENIQKAKEFFLAKDLAKNNATAAAPAAAAPAATVPPRTSPRMTSMLR